MAKNTKILLGISLVFLAVGLVFVTGIVNVQSVVAAFVVFPVGVVLLGLFLIFRMLEKESALYDAEQQAHVAFANAASPKAKSRADCCCDCATRAPETSSVLR